MPKKALCVGVNQYPAGLGLNGCVADAKGWTALLRDHYDFTDVRLMIDAEATKRNILDALKALLAGAQAKDVLAFTYSGHGTYIADTSGDEPTYDEAMCPVDIYDSLLIDDELRELFSNLPKDVRLTVVSDSCFSGTVTRAVFSEILQGFRSLTDLMPHLKKLLEWRVRFIHPSTLDILTHRTSEALMNPLPVKPKRMMYNQNSMKELVLTGCTDKEYSYDVRFPEGYYGAMSYTALSVIKAANYKISYSALTKQVNQRLAEGGYPQHPMCEGVSSHKRRQVFV